MDFVKLANSLDQAGLFKEADLIDRYCLRKRAEYGEYMDVGALSQSLYQILAYLGQRTSPEKQQGFWANVGKGLNKLVVQFLMCWLMWFINLFRRPIVKITNDVM